MIQYGWTVMCKDLGRNDIGEAQDVDSFKCTGKERGHQPRADEEFLKSLIRGVIGEDKP